MQQNALKWNDYKDWVSGLVKSKEKNYYFRGHSNAGWKLQTSFHREAGRNAITLTTYLITNLSEVNYHISSVHNEIIDLRNKDEFYAFLALIQHHGFPTPLLDWTLSPYVAAYFAFKEVNNQQLIGDNVKIYIFNYMEWTKSFKQPSDLEATEPYVSVVKPYAKFNKRLIAQQGAFTVTNVEDMEDHILGNSYGGKKTFLFNKLISVKEKPVVMRELNLMGINEMTLFPSIGGICRALKSQFFSSDAVGPTISDILEFISKTKPESSIVP